MDVLIGLYFLKLLLQLSLLFRPRYLDHPLSGIRSWFAACTVLASFDVEVNIRAPLTFKDDFYSVFL